VAHYMVDCYISADDILPDSFLLEELSDSGAINEAKAHCFHRKPTWFQVRTVRGLGDDRIVYDSRDEA